MAATAAARGRGRGSHYNFVESIAAVTAVTMRLSGLAKPRREKGHVPDDYGFDTRRVELSGAASMLFRAGEGRWALRGMCALFCLVFATMEKRWTRMRPRPPWTHVGALATAEADVSRLLLRPVGNGKVALAKLSSESELWSAFVEQEVRSSCSGPGTSAATDNDLPNLLSAPGKDGVNIVLVVIVLTTIIKINGGKKSDIIILSITREKIERYTFVGGTRSTGHSRRCRRGHEQNGKRKRFKKGSSSVMLGWILQK